MYFHILHARRGIQFSSIPYFHNQLLHVRFLYNATRIANKNPILLTNQYLTLSPERTEQKLNHLTQQTAICITTQIISVVHRGVI